MSFVTNLIEAGQRGMTRLFRLQDDTIDIFKEAENFDPESGYKTLDVDANGFGILYKDSPQRFLHTYNVNVCTGIALACPKEDFYALVHLYSNRAHYNVREAKSSIENHAQVAWKRFEGFLPPHMTFNAVSFGGKNQFAGVPSGEPTAEQVKKFHKGHGQDDGLIGTEEYEVLGQMAATASIWLADAFCEAALNSGRLEEHEDVRFRKHAHHVLVDKLTGKIYFGKVGDGLHQKIITHTDRVAGGGYIFPHLGIIKNQSLD